MTLPTDIPRCNYRDSAGRRCRLPRKPDHPAFCAHHARLSPERAIQDPQALVAEVLGPSPDFGTAQSVNHTAGKLLEAFLAGRIPPRHAAVAGYLCQLLIQTLHLLRVESESEGGEPKFYEYITYPHRLDPSGKIVKLDAAPEKAGIAESQTSSTPRGTQP